VGVLRGNAARRAAAVPLVASAAIAFGRVTGVACCVAASSAVCAFALTVAPGPLDVAMDSWGWIALPAGGLLMAAAFLVAPAPRVRDE
jgi:hypothetical protein